MIDLKEAQQVTERANGKRDEKFFALVVEEIPIKVREYSAKGAHCCIVAEVPSFGYRFRWYQPISMFLELVRGRHLVGVYREIFEHCKKQGLKPWVDEYGYDGGYYRIYIQW